MSPTLIALHGHGDSAESAQQWGNAIAPRNWQVIAPSAPLDADGSPSWFDTGPRGVDPDTLRRSVDEIESLCSQAVGGPVVVAGFSQGAALALHLAPSVRATAIVAMSGFLTDAELESGQGPPILITSNQGDEVIPGFLSGDAAEALRACGRVVEFRILEGPHAVTPSAASEARNWIAEKADVGMRASLGLPTDRVDNPDFVSGVGIARLARHFEEIGAAAAFVTDHPAPDDRWLAAGGHQALEPTVALTAAAMATERLKLHTHVYVLAYRNPFLAAKALASLDVVSGGRLILGVAAGYLKAEFAALGSNFEDRGSDLESSLRLLRRVWSESSVAAMGAGFEARSVTALPHPVQQPLPPIWVGGNTRAAMRRAVTLGDVWCPFPTPGGLDKATRTAPMINLDDLREAKQRLQEVSAENGRATAPSICFSPFTYWAWAQDPSAGAPALLHELRELADMGIRDLVLPVPGTSMPEVEHNASALMEMVSSVT